MTRKTKVILAFLCLSALFCTGPARPFFVYAAADDTDEPTGDEYYADENIDESGSKPAASAAPSAPNVQAKYQDDIDELNDKLSALAKKQKDIEKSISGAKDQKAKALAEKNYLAEQITITMEEIELLSERIAVLEKKITAKEKDIVEQQGEIDRNYEILRKRLRAMYKQDATTTLGLILGADSFADFLTRTEYVVRIAEHDRDLLQTLTDQRLSLEQDKADLQRDKSDVEDTRAETEDKKQTLVLQESKATEQVQNLDEMERAYLADLANNKKLQDAAQQELDDIYKRIEWETSPYVGGEMAWPLPGFTKITSGYGLRFNGADMHGGVDISGTNVHGHDIVAANAGTVKFVNWTYKSGVGYGIYLIIDHGGNISTLYGHCSNIVVNVGDVVSRGQKVAEVGSTGWSTGPHLHFEVRVNSKHVPPLPYITGGQG